MRLAAKSVARKPAGGLGEPRRREAGEKPTLVRNPVYSSLALHAIAAGETPRPSAAAAGEAPRKVHRAAEDDELPAARAQVLVSSVLASRGAPLPAATQGYFEARFQASFEDVRVHTDGDAAAAAKAVRAEAFAVGEHVAFADGMFAPESAEGRRLIAHELTHVLQQRGRRPARRLSRKCEGCGGSMPCAACDEERLARAAAGAAPSGLAVSQPGDPLEREADRVAEEVVAGGARSEVSGGDAVVARSCPGSDDYPGECRIADQIKIADKAVARKSKEYADTFTSKDASLSQLVELRKDLAVFQRLKFLFELLDQNSEDGYVDESRVDDDIAKVWGAAWSEDSTLALLGTQDFLNTSGLDVANDVLVTQAGLFPEHVVALYESITADLRKKARKYSKEFDDAAEKLASQDIDWLVKLMMYLIKNEDWVVATVNLVNVHSVIDPFKPIFVERRDPDATTMAANDLMARSNDHLVDATPKAVASSLGVLYPALVAYAGAVEYGQLAHTMSIFSVGITETYERLNRPGEPADAAADLLRAHDRPPGMVTGPDGGIVVGAGVGNARGGYYELKDVLLKRLDKWVAGLSGPGRIWEGFGIYDLAGDVVSNLKALFTLKAIAVLIATFAVFAAIQLVPFGNIVADALMLAMFGADVLKLVVILIRYFAAAGGQTSFMGLYRSTIQLQGAGEAIVSLGTQLVLWAGSKAAGKFLSMKGKKWKSVEEMKAEPAMKELGPDVVKALDDAAKENKGFESWRDKLSPETQRAIKDNPELAKTYAEMDPGVRDLLTLCASDCVPKTATPEDAGRIRQLMDKLDIKPGTEEHRLLREFLHNKTRRENLKDVVDGIENVDTKQALTDRVNQEIAGAAKKGTAKLNDDGVWEYTPDGASTPVQEYQVGVHKSAPGTDSFFQSHHGVQGAWARARFKKYYDYNGSQTILLRDSNAGSPHQICNARQGGRTGDLTTRTYAQERANMMADMKAAGVPDAYTAKLVAASDAQFAGMYKKMVADGVGEPALKDAFGDWTPPP